MVALAVYGQIELNQLKKFTSNLPAILCSDLELGDANRYFLALKKPARIAK